MSRPSFSGPETCRWTAVEAVRNLKSKKISPAELLADSLTRISQVEPAVNALPTLCQERANEQIRELDASQGQNHPGWLGGLPLAIKDLNAVSGVRSTWGTKALAEYVPEQSHPLVEMIEQRGGITVGKSNSPEMGAGGNTFNDVFGATKNPWDITKNAGGSSGGAAVALATGEVWLAHGSDLAGSLRTPAAYCGIVGLRPSPGRSGGGPLEAGFLNMSAQGPMARNIQDCALFLDVMSGFDPRMPLSLPAPPESFLSAVSQNPGRIRIGFAPDQNGFAPVEPEIRDIMANALKNAADTMLTIEESCPELGGLEDTYVTLRGSIYGTLTGKAPDHIQTHFKGTLKENIKAGQNLSADQIYEAERHRTLLHNRMLEWFARFDVLACAVVGLEPGPVEEEYPLSVNGVATSDYIDWLKFSFLAPTCGLPALSMPCGFTRSGLPVGLQLIGQPRGEARLLQIAASLEARWGLAQQVPIDPVGSAPNNH